MKIIFSELARKEMADAIRFYENRVHGLGKRLESEIVRASSRISEHPEAWPVERGTIRKCLLHKFPYKLVYSVETDHIFVIAFAHQRRMPNYWMDES